MSHSVFDAFIGKDFDPVFALTAVTSHAEAALRSDVAALHPEARDSVIHVTDAASSNESDPADRIALIEGGAGMGKTHRLVAALLELSRAGRVYPAVMQLSAKVDPEMISLWMLQKVLDELCADHFCDGSHRPPLKRMADMLWVRAPDSLLRSRFEDALEDEDPDAVAVAAVEAAIEIQKAFHADGLKRSHRPLLAALLLLADDASHEVNAWLRGGAATRIGNRFDLPALKSEKDRQDALIELAEIARVTGAPIIIAIDQVEAITIIGSDSLLIAVVTTALQLVENTPGGLGVILSVLLDTYQDVIRKGMHGSFRQRIELGEPPVTLNRPDLETLRKVIDRRVECLMERAGFPSDPAASRLIAPDWLLNTSDATTVRGIIDAVREYRRACRKAGRFLAQDEYSAPQGSQPDETTEDFDKLWEDARDADLGAVANYSPYDREQMFVWLAQNAGRELKKVSGTSAEPQTLQDAAATRMIDLRFASADGGTGERWKIAFADAPNQKGQLFGQIRSALDSITDAKPALLRNGRMPGITDSGEPDRPESALRKLQAGPALFDLFAAGGRVAITNPKDWQRLNLARRFFEERKDAAGFSEWCVEKSFLLEHAGIGQMTRLVKPEAAGPEGSGSEEPRSGGPMNTPEAGEIDPSGDKPAQRGHGEGGVGSGTLGPVPAGTGDPRNHARILIGHDLGGSKVCWNLDRDADPALPNFGLLVSGDAGQGKTQFLKAVIAEAAGLNCPILIFDFKNDYSGSFAEKHGLTTFALNDGLPFNPLKIPPQGPSGAQAIDHIFEVAGILATTLHLGDQQKALLRNALEEAFSRCDVPLREWVDPETTPAPALSDVVAIAEEIDEKKSESLINRLGLLHGKRLLPSDQESRIKFADFMGSRSVLSFANLPNDDQLKRALAELILIQLQGYMLRGGQPRALRSLLIFDEAWRASDSKRLIQLAREGRAFGVGVVAGSQFAGDLSDDLTGNLASKLHLFNSDAGQRRKIVQSTFGTVAGQDAKIMMEQLGDLKEFQGAFMNQQYSPYVLLAVLPYYQRT